MFRKAAAAGVALAISISIASAEPASGAESPNIVLVFTDDQGYGDVGCYGARGFTTPHLDAWARDGIRMTSFYVAQAVCGASRAALLTGCYPNRLGMLGAPNHTARHGIHERELLLPEMLKKQGYATAMFGKWHLGHHPKFLPTRHGFDEYFGLPYSNDMWPHHPTAKDFPDLPLIEGEQTIAVNPDQTQLTTWYTERAVDFIDRHKDHPFFLYVAHNMPHVPLHVSDKHRDKSSQGLYGDVIAEIDWSVGQIDQALARHGLTDNTLVIFTTDNGPWLSYGDHAGSAGPLREGKGTTWEGGVRVPCIMRWPGRIPAGRVCDESAATIDILPTIARITGAALPEAKIDGTDIWPVLAAEPGAESSREAYYFYWGNELQAVRAGDWKLHFPHDYRALTGQAGQGGRPGGYTNQRCQLELYNLASDVGETRNVVDEHPEVVSRLKALAEAMREELGDSLQNRKGIGVRPAGSLDN